MIVYLERIVPPGPLPVEPADVLSMSRTRDSFERENVWLKTQLDRLLRKVN